MKLDKEFEFFAYLPESYADYKDTTAHDVLQLLAQKQLTDFVYDMYEMYHSEADGPDPKQRGVLI